MDNRVVILVIGVVIAAVWFWSRYRHSPSRSAEARLRGICFGNEGQVERLIASEMSRAPGISRAEAALRAVDRYRRDNR
jgi:hypothetical protein